MASDEHMAPRVTPAVIAGMVIDKAADLIGSAKETKTVTLADGEMSDESSSSLAGSEDDEKKDKVMVGMICDKKGLYEKIDQHNKATWTDKYPEDLEEAAENEETEKYALLIRNKKSYDSRKKLEIDSIVIQSPLLKTVMRDVLNDYPGVTTTLSRLTFSAPFQPFVHRWYRLVAALEGEGDYDEDTKTHLKLLRDVLYEELRDVIAATEDYIKNKVVTYDHIWTIFQPGCNIYASRGGKPVVVRLADGQFIQHAKLGPCFHLKCERVDWDGSKFGYTTSSHFILPFVGTTPVTDLDSYPLSYHSDEGAITAKLTARGRLFEGLAGYHYREYKGVAIQTTQYGPSLITVDGRIVVDGDAHSNANPNQQLYLKPLNRVEPTRSNRDPGYGSDDESDYEFYDEYPSYGEEDAFLDHSKKTVPLTEEELLLCTPVIRGYALKPKLWLEFFVESVCDIAFNSKAFDSLVLPAGHKSLILAFAQSQVKNKTAFDDVISGKGRGIIMLLSGGPGIGKTLTAESVAEDMRAPLYMMSVGDLGINSREVEANLTKVLDMVAKWDAVLLLDECDVFLEARSPHDLDRNRIVSIFLRTLEYYEGILFLTTNRVRNMDEAFHSRIHFSLEYPPLDEQARRAVWRGFLDRQGGHEVGEQEVKKLARLDINGRIIKNVLKTGTLLASHKDERLGFEHLQTVLQVEGRAMAE
ncbi:Uu.00g088000.m01.CDS01 [Anthostomella pinea]|uniref:Uu.00g088000.m01.CDS01 n=1 Tax=Anthostomella pinea TaxID=933095 RepID=A0AAI8VMF4_9PEZI|nr:Uu.00g088000.m01.CDS01 [Anthostomella pinea]